MTVPIQVFHFADNFYLQPEWNIICYISLALFAIYWSLGVYWGVKFYKYKNEQILRNRFSNLTMMEITFILCRIISNFLVITSDLIAQIPSDDNRYAESATILRQIAFHCGVFFDFCTVYWWAYRFWCIYFAMHWITAAYNIQWQKLIDQAHKSDDNWYLKNKKKWGNYKYLRKYVISCVLLSSAIAIPLRFCFDFAEDRYDYIGVSAHGLLVLIPGIFLIYIFCKLPEFEDFIYVAKEIRYISVILIVIYVFGLVISEIAENVFSEKIFKDRGFFVEERDQIKILIAYYNVKEFGNFICLYIATGWVLKMVKPLIIIGKEGDYSQKRKMAQRTYMPKVTMTERSRYHTNSSNTYISEDKRLLEDQLDVFENMSNLPLEDYERASSEKDRGKINAIQTTKGLINMSDVLQHPKSFDIFMIHLSREFRYDIIIDTIYLSSL